MSSKRKLVIKSVGKRRGKLLDIGCGRGLFLHTMDVAGWEVSGLEPDATARAWCNNEYGLDVLAMEELADIPTNSMDVITMWHVLEHVHELAHMLDELKRILKHDGRLLVALPNYTSFDARFYQGYWAAYDPPRHIYHFNQATIEELSERNGLRLLDTAPMPLDAFYASMLSEKYQGGKGKLTRAIVVGLRSWWNSLGAASRSSSILYELCKGDN